MKILIICSHRYYAPYTDYVAPFIYEQMQGLKQLGCDFRICFVQGGGLKSYWQAWKNLCKMIDEYKPDLVHAHYGLCCVIANLQRRVPVVSTYHGSDINDSKIRVLSKIAIRLSQRNIFVSERLMSLIKRPKRIIVIPCSVDTTTFYPMNKLECRKQLGMDLEKKYILFSKEFADTVKNYPLAKQAVEIIDPQAELLEFYGYTREQVPLLYNAVDLGLMTSFTEGSPQFIKEAVACGCPVVSTDVGDVREVIDGVSNCYLSTYEVDDVVNGMQKVLTVGHLQKTHIHERYTAEYIAKTIFELYTSICSQK
ncbi:MAG: glycosyltransferase family 4 protein [Paludibacteraceae bacterium]|nr:glycosyltransferase family 4 protein [Paludibacteraceae bacterium]